MPLLLCFQEGQLTWDTCNIGRGCIEPIWIMQRAHWAAVLPVNSLEAAEGGAGNERGLLDQALLQLTPKVT